MSQTSPEGQAAEYSIRPYESGDADRFLSLYETVWGTTKSRAWFDWRFAANPRSDGIEMIVAEADGQLVGAEPLLPYRLRAGDEVLDAYQPVDWIVHPEYRRQGIFSAMTESLLSSVGADADLLFNFPNEQLLPGIQKFDWQAIATATCRYRVQDPAAVAMREATGSRSTPSLFATAASPIVRGGLRMCDRFAPAHADVSISRVRGVPVETVSERYDASVPPKLHVPRDRAYLEWRFANPRWETTTYVARRDGGVVTTAVVASESVDGSQLVRVLDVQPMTEAVGDAEAFEAIVRAVVTDNPDASVLKAPTGLFPGVLRRSGFLRDDSFPLSRFSAATYHAVRPLDDAFEPAAASTDDGAGHRGDALDLTDPDDWLLALGDHDVA
ncbi:hypothetical protein L593_12720 [Salinarchaeum sp. Harcht-Bsk1]|uniref:GNAT family N-acetyltransferase n=1 Tax=Salinarchaeum sp. Harcht-Bsk1 TaxID=1333523 RepID=UPI00034234BB|nr:GNAT family N-acetyltransferase [Salinarchaeum sp. Harcht-Bsk1]AGN02483.1 hypothetical protein L593_12720 [Salinarchaeum sp. Harcht-Bsk1]